LGAAEKAGKSAMRGLPAFSNQPLGVLASSLLIPAFAGMTKGAGNENPDFDENLS